MRYEDGESFVVRRSPKKLRILHIGNIANNAYLNAKILNEAGFDCDVLSNSYYHIMGSPEWEDADFIGDAGSEVLPNWSKVDLQGFRRPRWFAQGPLDTCIRYLAARRQKSGARERLNWYLLEAARFIKRYPRLEVFLEAAKWMIKYFPLSVIWVIKKRLPIKRNNRLSSQQPISKSLAPRNLENKSNVGRPDDNGAPQTVSVRVALHKVAANQPCNRLVSDFFQMFPERVDQLTENDLESHMGTSYQRTAKKLADLFGHYDIIQAYGTDPILALLSGVHPYIAFEHGTIRSIPFEESSQGRLTALSYCMADGVIITNCDNKRAAERLDLHDYRFIPHPINEKWIQPGIGESLRERLHRELAADFIIFHPSRQHWDAERHPSWEKGNDILIEGMARVVHETGMSLSAIFVEWGQKVAQSKNLIAHLGIEKNIKWVPPMHSANMSRYIDACDLLADQFFLGAFGSTMPRALALGKPAMIYLDEEIHRWCFPEMPPVINARTPDQVYKGLKRALEDPSWLADLAQKGKTWYQKYHSGAVIQDRLSSFYEDVLNKQRQKGQNESS
jgi:glycosyltransferase involved in cell wall biosynthesis